MSDIKGVISDAVAAFWGEFSRAFPEVTSGDTQLSGEPEAAMSIWLVGDPGDEPVMTGRHDHASFFPSRTRIDDAIQAGLAAAQKALLVRSPQLGAAPEEVVAQLKGCVCEVLYWNYPRPMEGEEEEEYFLLDETTTYLLDQIPAGDVTLSIRQDDDVEDLYVLIATVDGVEYPTAIGFNSLDEYARHEVAITEYCAKRAAIAAPAAK